MTSAEFATIAEEITIFYPRENFFTSERALDLWFRELEEFNAEAVEKATRHWVRKERRGPTVADLRKLAQEYGGSKAVDWNELQEQRRILEEQRRRTAETEETT